MAQSNVSTDESQISGEEEEGKQRRTSRRGLYGCTGTHIRDSGVLITTGTATEEASRSLGFVAGDDKAEEEVV